MRTGDDGRCVLCDCIRHQATDVTGPPKTAAPGANRRLANHVRFRTVAALG
jgi:hypothetical protein